MPFNVDEFLSNISSLDGPMAPSRFEISITPSGRNEILPTVAGVTATRFITFSAYATNIPGIILDSDYILQRGYGRINEIPVRPTIGNCDISFYLDEKMETYRYLHNWLNAVVTTDGTLTAGGQNFGAHYHEVQYPDKYYATINISCYSQTKRRILDVILDDCYPSELSGLNLDWGNTDTVATASLSVVFKHMRMFRGENEYMIPRGGGTGGTISRVPGAAIGGAGQA